MSLARGKRNGCVVSREDASAASSDATKSEHWTTPTVESPIKRALRREREDEEVNLQSTVDGQGDSAHFVHREREEMSTKRERRRRRNEDEDEKDDEKRTTTISKPRNVVENKKMVRENDANDSSASSMHSEGDTWNGLHVHQHSRPINIPVADVLARQKYVSQLRRRVDPTSDNVTFE